MDHGGELFGNFTLLSDGTVAPHGYAALAEFDDASLGGNQNGEIDAGDSVFASLRLWIDVDHDGVSDLQEILSLEEAGVIRLDLDYRESRRRDRHGNLLWFWSAVWLDYGQGTLRSRAVDVFFQIWTDDSRPD
ncbi:MAG: hypothetical protein AAGC60_00605 [Acidobacteriota bacterium]